MVEAPVVVTCAVARRSADTGGTHPARLTQTILVILALVPDDVRVITIAVELCMIVRNIERIAGHLGRECRRQRRECIGPARAIGGTTRHPNRRNKLPFTD